MDVATLGLEVVSAGVAKATADLNRLTNASKVAENAARGLTDATGRMDPTQIAAMAANMGAVTREANSAAKALAAEALAAQKAASAANVYVSAANQNVAATKASGQSAAIAQMQVRNLAFQFQDIGTMLASGQSPFILLAQQLPQVTMYGGQLNGVMGALRSTFAGLFSPLGLLTTGFVLLGSVAVSYFTEWFSRGKEANLTIEEQGKLIRNVAQEWGNAAPKLKAYADELDRLAKARDLLAAGNSAAEAQFVSIVDILGSINQQYTAAIRNLRGYGSDTDSVVRGLTTSFSNLQSKIMEGSATTADLKAAQDALATAVDGFGTPAVNAFADAFANLVPRIDEAINKAASFRAEAAAMSGYARMMDPGTWRSAGMRGQSPDGTIQGGDFEIPNNPAVPTSRPLVELEGLPKARGGRSANDNFKSSIQSIQERTRAVQAETAAQATLNPLVNDYGYAVSKAKVETDLLLAAEKDKKAITPELTAQISEQAEAYAVAVAEQNRLTEATRKAQEALNFVKNTTAGFINDLRNGLKNGESFWSSFGDAALNVLDRITDRLLNQVMDAIFKVGDAAGGVGGGGGILGGILGLFGLGGGSSSAAPSWLNNGFDTSPMAKYASGTASARAGLALVGEEGPEIVRFKGGEQVIPNHRIFPAANENGSAEYAQPREIVLRVIGEEGPMFRPTIRSESQDVAVTVVQENNKARQNLYQNGEAQYG